MTMKETTSNSEFIGHEACPSCGSRDNLARYDDGHAWCFGCNYYENDNQVVDKGVSMDFVKGEYIPLTKRGITKETTEKTSAYSQLAVPVSHPTFAPSPGGGPISAPTYNWFD